MSILIKNVNVITMNKNKDIIEDGVVVVRENLIVDVGDKSLISNYSDCQIIDGEGGILIPGMVNAHTHASMVVFRSLGDDVPDRLQRYIFPLEKKMVDEQLVYIGAKYAIVEMLLGGVTTFADMYYFEDEVAKAVQEAGIRAVLGETVVNFSAPDCKESYGGLDYSKWFIEKWKDSQLITPAVAPHAPYTNSEESLKKIIQISEKYDVPIMMHAAEMKYEFEDCIEKYNMTPMAYLDSIGMLNERFVGAHLIHVTDEDLKLIKERKVGISHNVGANAKGGKGTAPAVKMYKSDMKIGLGTDGAMSGNTLDIITQMSLVGKVHKLINEDRTLFPASEIVEMATIGGARALNMDDEIGSIEVGKKADLVIMETKSINMQPIYDYYSALVYSANPSNVDTVMVNGKILVENKCLKSLNIGQIMYQIKSVREKIQKFGF
ncbi:amidohydrolase [Clostridium ganghwense]|uniref:Amidohydrolase n=1 Tax=Clostridium ganghwense TaxID=312089 RepID=A0ABT4CMK3_9CLOT|nr:amidohydrolase [Clostridium ganghwense]MCY6369461.1 amidohydrolase [Clostridium ganghwense]